MSGRRKSTKRLFALLLTVLCVAARFQCIICPSGGRGGGGGVGEAEGGGGAGAGEGEEGGEGAGGSWSGNEEEAGSTYTYNWWGGAVAVGPGVDPNAAAGPEGLISVWILSGAFAAVVVSMALVARVRRAAGRRGSSKLTRSVGACCQHV
ncbi:hypothetical protein ZWY2020_043677 [Hordeum vulgare]|nr:hypothetical protein ZWY2020_043677 [Hordeum vulgare]